MIGLRFFSLGSADVRWGEKRLRDEPRERLRGRLNFERSFEIYMSVLNIANEISEFP